MTEDPYQPPAAPAPDASDANPGPPPRVVMWFKIYAGFLAFLFLIVTAVGIVFFTPAMAGMEEELDGMPPMVLGFVYVIMGVPLFLVSILPFFLKNRPWVWIYNLVLICLGMSGCTIVFAVPLLIFWIKPEVKVYYGREP
ncbi:MAG: hypothetical protein AAGJ31_12295 [Verrucomicrobiota bacterium]